jgi:hypothetical protein
MNKIKKCLLNITAIMTTAIFVISGTVNATTRLDNIKDDTNEDESVYVSSADLVDRDDLYCVEKGASLDGIDIVYTVQKYIKIEGNTAWNTAGTSVTDNSNGVLAYILSKNMGYSNGVKNFQNTSEAQNAIWAYINTWYSNVGDALGANWSYDNNTGDEDAQIINDAKDYANSIGSANTTITDNTDKSNISTTAYNENGKSYVRVGPFNWNFEGSLSNIYVYDENNSEYSKVWYSRFEGDSEVFINESDVSSDENFYVTVEATSEHTKISSISAKGKIDTGSVYTAELWFLGNSGTQRLMLVKTGDKPTETEINADFNYDITLTKNLEIYKVDSRDEKLPLVGVGFVLQNKDTNKYVKQTNGILSYVDNRSEATEFMTDSNGKIKFENLIMGTYVAYETKNPNYGYEIIKDGIEIPINQTSITIKNIQKYIKLSGYIWKDVQSGKQTVRNDLYKDDEYDVNDESFNGITVRLKDKDGNTLKETKSSENGLYNEITGGEYIFEDVEIEKLADYYIEFEYDGLIYQSVAININKNNGSKSTDKVERDVLDKNFTSVEATGENRVNVNNKYSIGYTNTQDHVAKINDSSSCIIHAKTNDAGYNIANYFKPGTKEIRYINLGLYEKPQADLAIANDLENVNVGVNGYWHVYKYGKRLNDSGMIPDNSDSWNVGVKFKNSYTGTYKRAVYESDVNYQTNDKSKEMQVYLTYKIAIRNESSYLTKANSIVNYFDNRYELVAAGTGIDGQNNITGNLNIASSEKYNEEYNKAVIDTNTVIKSGESNYLYVQYKLNREAVLQILNNKETLYSTVEINSYTVYKDNNGNTVAAVDIDSVPGNMKVGNVDTYEDDTDAAPPVQLELTDARKIAGTVFVDSTTGELKTGEIRQGNGQFDNGENTVSGVKVTLHELNNSIGNIETTTDANGNYEFAGYIPGQYTITYTWGDKDYKVQYYKGTVYDSSRDQNNKEWYKDAVDTRKTDAIDNYEERKAIDKEVANITNHTVGEEVSKAYNGEQSAITITKMNSVTPTMEFGVEYETTITDGTADKVEFIVKNVDFGIVERARQKLDLQKRVSTFKVTLANGQVLADAKVTEDGKLEGTTNHMTYMGPSTSGNGYVKLETDDELIEGATLNITYQIKAINQSEVDYMSENYYKYGIKEGNIATLTPSAVIDYLDKNLGFEDNDNKDESGNSIWQQISKVKLQEFKAQKVNDGGYLDNKKILYTDKIAKPIKPGDTKTVDLKVSKLLSSSTDMTFNNDAEVAKITSNDGQNPPVVPPTYPPVVSAEDSIVVPSTGANMNYAFPTIVGIVSLVILGIGIFVIKKKIIQK